MVNYSGPTAYDNKVGPYFKMGIYHPAWKAKNAGKKMVASPVKEAITFYADEVRIAKAPADFAKVSPAK